MSLFLDMAALAVNKESIALQNTPDRWTAVAYETKFGVGTLLITPQASKPEDIVLQLGLEGWHRIYLGMIDMGGDTYTHVKLTDDAHFSEVGVSLKDSPRIWASYEYIQEFYWRSADLSGQQLILRKPDCPFNPKCSNLVWIRCEKMDEQEAAQYNAPKNRCLQAHFDIDPYILSAEEDESVMALKLHALRNSNVEFCCMETWVFNDRIDPQGFMPQMQNWPKEWPGRKFDSEKLLRTCVDYAHSLDLPLYVGYRMSTGEFLGIPYYNNHFNKDNPQFYCKNRDGRTVKACSYAYEQTRRYMVDSIKTSASCGFDGVSLFFIRGMHIGFEQPVLDRFEQLYPGLDARTLPFSDPRLHGVWCEFMTAFMRQLRSELGDSVKINVITDYGLATSKHLGVDVEEWAKLGLINSASQADMEVFERLDGCLNPDGTVDLEKYMRKQEDTEVIDRRFGTDVDRVCEHIPEYLALEQYGIKVYHVLPWVHSQHLADYDRAIERMQACGARNFLAWNTNHLLWNQPEFHAATDIGNPGTSVADRNTFYRVLMLGGHDISGFNPNWKG